jgi:hypothetical protein
MGSSSGSNPAAGASGADATGTGAGAGAGAGTAVATDTSASAATGAGAAVAPSLPIALKVSFTLNTPDGLRQISFGLEKDTDGVTVNWTITFTLFERTHSNKPFGDAVVSLNVFVATTLHAKAETAAHNGLTPAQTAHATGPAANAAKAAHDGTMPLPVANNIIQGTLK